MRVASSDWWPSRSEQSIRLTPPGVGRVEEVVFCGVIAVFSGLP